MFCYLLVRVLNAGMVTWPEIGKLQVLILVL